MKEPWKLLQKRGISFFTFPLGGINTPAVSVGFSTRLSGVSSGPFASLNLGFKSGDINENVLENRRRFLALWEKKEQDLVIAEQVHGKRVVEVNGISNQVSPPAADSLVTTKENTALGAFSADCVLAFFYDPQTPAVGIAHAGWRGTVSGMLFETVQKMEKYYSLHKKNIQVALAPSIRPCCYEVGPLVIESFKGSPWRREAVFHKGEKVGYEHLDLQETNKNILLRAGLKKENIFVSGYCTCCNSDLFYSYRRAQGESTGSMMGIIFLNGTKSALTTR